jgi:hypothetical protein
MQTRDSRKQSDEGEGKGEEKRDLELENIVGNLLVAEYQVDRLRTRLDDITIRHRPQMKNNNKTSSHLFKHNNKWYKLSLRIDETDTNSVKERDWKNNQFTGNTRTVTISPSDFLFLSPKEIFLHIRVAFVYNILVTCFSNRAGLYLSTVVGFLPTQPSNKGRNQDLTRRGK